VTPFDKFCQNQNLLPSQAAKLVRLANEAFKAGERACTEDSNYVRGNELSTAAVFSKYTESLGFKVDWPGLWPSLTKDGYEVFLPESIEGD
jgi:hypothetical protein